MADDQRHEATDASLVQAALQDLIDAFAVDDYQLSVTSFDAAVLRLAIDAGPLACAECLVPQPMLASLVRNTLPPAIHVAAIEIRYPVIAKTDPGEGSPLAPEGAEQVGGVDEFRALSLFSGPADVADGVPLLPVGRLCLARAVAASGRAADAVIGAFPDRAAMCTADLAEVAMRAGCREDAMPLLIAVFEIMTGPHFPIALFTDSRGSFFPYLVVNGPIRHTLGINCRSNVFGPGFRANATIGRAVRLGLQRFAGARMDAGGPSALGTAFRFTCVVGEDEENSPWPPLHVSLGRDPGESSVMVLAARQPGHVTHQLSVLPGELAAAFADELTVAHCYQGYDVALPEGGYRPHAILVIGEDHRGYFRDAGWDRPRLQAALAAAAVRDPAAVRGCGYTLDPPHAPFTRPDGLVSPYAEPADFLVVAAGSGGGRSMIGSAVYADLRPIPAIASAAEPATVAGSPRSFDDYRTLVAKYMEAGATDGWPIIPPDADGVAALIAATGQPADRVVGTAPWRPNPVTLRDVMTNAYMAGCGPEHAVLLAPMFETMFSPEAQSGLGGMAASTGGYTCWFIVHGPVARALGINRGSGLFGPGAYANVAIGRAIRLALLNLAGLKPNLADRSCVGQAYKYGVVFATDDRTWGPLELGGEILAGGSGFSLLWGFHTRLILNEQATAPEPLLRSIADGMTTVQNFDSPSGRGPGDTKTSESGGVWIRSINARSLYVVMSEGHRAILDRAGWTRARAQAFLAANAVRRIGDLRRAGFGTSPFFEPDQHDDETVSLVTGPDKIVPIAAGGPGGATLCFSAPLVLTRRLPV